MELGLKGRIAAVTGGTEGIGRATALRFAREGAGVAICARRAEPLQRVAGEIAGLGAGVLTVAADIGRPADCERFVKATVERFGRIDILVNTVCIGKIKSGQHERRYAREGISAEEYYARVSRDIPLRRVGEAEEVANVIAFLASGAASYVTGSSLNLDGGTSGVL